MDPAYYLKINRGLDVIRVGQGEITVHENDFQHSDWCVETSLLPEKVIEEVHVFCNDKGIDMPEWSVMAYRRY